MTDRSRSDLSSSPNRATPSDRSPAALPLPFWSDVWRRFRTNRPAMIGIALLVVFALLAIFVPIASPYDHGTAST